MPTKKEEVAETLSDVTLPSREDGKDDVKFDQEAAMLMEDIHTMGGLMLAYQSNLDAHEGVFVHTFFKHMEDYGKMGKEAVKPVLLDVGLGAGGKATTDIGTITASEVAAKMENVFTNKTRDLLESQGILPQCAEMMASMKTGIDVETISDDDMEVLEKYFNIELVLSQAKVNAQIELGHIDALAVEATTEEQQTRAGYTRLAVKPNDDLKSYLGIEDVVTEK